MFFFWTQDVQYFTWALIFLMGVAPPDPVDLEPVDSDLKHLDTVMVSIFIYLNFSSNKTKYFVLRQYD